MKISSALAADLSQIYGSSLAPKQTGYGTFQQALQQASTVSSPASLEGMFQSASQATGVPVNLLKAVAKAESDFDPKSLSHCGAAGIMQLMPDTARTVGVTDVWDPAENILGGAKYLRMMLDRHDGDVTLALAAYNAGPGNVKKYGGVPPFKETQNYIKKITKFMGGSLDIGTLPPTAHQSSNQTFGIAAQSPTAYAAYGYNPYANVIQAISSVMTGNTSALPDVLNAFYQTGSMSQENALLFCDALKTLTQTRLLNMLSQNDKENDDYLASQWI